MLGALYANVGDGRRSALGYTLILFFATIVFSLFQEMKKELYYFYMLDYYKIFFLIVPIFSIINFILNIITDKFNFLTNIFSTFEYAYQASPFGFILYKDFFGINLSRSMFFFIEPVFLAFFYLLNIFIIAKNDSKSNKYFIILNYIGGILTSSLFFYLGYIIIQFIKIKNKRKYLFLFLIILTTFILQKNYPNFLDATSYGDRYIRLGIGLEILQKFTFERLVFGSGFLFDHGFEKGVSSGIISSFIEGGFIGLIFPLIMAIIFCEKNIILIIIVLLTLFLFEPFKFPFFWVSLILAGKVSKNF
jgi:hypothetical protein